MVTFFIVGVLAAVTLAAENPIPTDLSAEGMIATEITSIFFNLDGIQDHYNQGVAGMGQTTVISGSVFGFSPGTNAKLARLVYAPTSPLTGPFEDQIPAGFLDELDGAGHVVAPPGACGGGASAKVLFVTDGDVNLKVSDRETWVGLQRWTIHESLFSQYSVDKKIEEILEKIDSVAERRERKFQTPLSQENPRIAITGELLEKAQLSNITFEILVGEGDQSLNRIFRELISPTDMRLLTPEGWNEAVWQPLKEYQEPAESLMDYHLWSIAPELEQIILDELLAQLKAMGVPGVVMDAFENSDRYGWFANLEPEPDDRLSFMAIEAEFSGDLEDGVYEERDFFFPDPGGLREFGEMLGAGKVIYTHPELGEIDFEVGVKWTGWDEMGRVDVGIAYLYNPELDYAIEMSFNEDGTKTGEVIVEGETVGEISLSVEGTSTYIQAEE